MKIYANENQPYFRKSAYCPNLNKLNQPDPMAGEALGDLSFGVTDPFGLTAEQRERIDQLVDEDWAEDLELAILHHEPRTLQAFLNNPIREPETFNVWMRQLKDGDWLDDPRSLRVSHVGQMFLKTWQYAQYGAEAARKKRGESLSPIIVCYPGAVLACWRIYRYQGNELTYDQALEYAKIQHQLSQPYQELSDYPVVQLYDLKTAEDIKEQVAFANEVIGGDPFIAFAWSFQLYPPDSSIVNSQSFFCCLIDELSHNNCEHLFIGQTGVF